MIQKKLIDIPSKSKCKKSKLSKRQRSVMNILQAKRTGNWSNVTDTDFTFYFIDTNNRIMDRDIVFNQYTSVTAIREGLREKFNIPKEKMCKYIDELFNVYKTHPDRWESLTFGMITNNSVLMSNLMKQVEINIKEKELNNNTKNKEIKDAVF